MATVPETNQILLNNDMIDILCGYLIGQSEYRKVFDCALLPGYVVKVEMDGSSFRNVREFEAWEAVMYTEHSKWFAQIHSISSNGRVLIMEKTQRPGFNEWPTHVPAYMTDLKRENFGMSMMKDPKTGIVSNRFVAHDYSHHLLLENGMTKRMRRVDWEPL
jgi:hypothetical protein